MVIPAHQARPESERIAFLMHRDGHEVTRAWVARTIGIYEVALADPRDHASDPAYRPLFERAVREFRDWLQADEADQSRPSQAVRISTPTPP